MSTSSKKPITFEVETGTLERLQRARVEPAKIKSLAATAREALALGLDTLEARLSRLQHSPSQKASL